MLNHNVKSLDEKTEGCKPYGLVVSRDNQLSITINNYQIDSN